MRCLRKWWGNNPHPHHKERKEMIKMTSTDRYNIMNKHLAFMRKYEPRWINEENPKKYEAPEKSGLYLIGNTVFNPETDEKFYAVKIGISSNLAKRMAGYRTHNPFVFHIDFLEAEADETPYYENIFHWLFSVSGGKFMLDNEEWFLFSEEAYKTICIGGFGFLMWKAIQIEDDFLDIVKDNLEKHCSC